MAVPHCLQRAQLVPRPLDEVFAFFSDAYNLETITPPAIGFEILTPPPIVVREGTLIDYRIRLLGLPVRWRSRIETVEPLVRFSDVQLRGPYRSWHHLHEFFATAGGTLVVDTVDYSLPLGPLGALAHGLFVRRMLNHIFDYRRGEIARRFGTEAPAARRSA